MNPYLAHHYRIVCEPNQRNYRQGRAPLHAKGPRRGSVVVYPNYRGHAWVFPHQKVRRLGEPGYSPPPPPHTFYRPQLGKQCMVLGHGGRTLGSQLSPPSAGRDPCQWPVQPTRTRSEQRQAPVGRGDNTQVTTERGEYNAVQVSSGYQTQKRNPSHSSPQNSPSQFSSTTLLHCSPLLHTPQGWRRMSRAHHSATSTC